ncbi:MAG TPA: quinolinate synthase NadA [Candidatus Coproplasma excrementipullorum]|nr:quinolinate synthase NadA [Candidatus Coproplasma excrementipullorum]
MTVRQLQDKILQLKHDTDTCILAHSYMSEDICEVADFTGDSYALAVKAKSTKNKNVIMCGVRFMAEMVKMLNPQKRVLLSNSAAGCPMAEQMDKELIQQVKGQYPDYAVVAYVNTTAELKTIADVCVTSSSAVKICRAIPAQNILFIPDINLGTYVKEQVPEKNFKLLSGGCPTHAKINESEVLAAKKAHPGALFLVHPECRPDVVKHADYVGSTTGIMDFAARSENKEFIIGTENSIVQHLQFAYPEKAFYPLSKDLVCNNMKVTTLSDVYHCLTGDGGEEIVMDEETRLQAVKCIEEMIKYGG